MIKTAATPAATSRWWTALAEALRGEGAAWLFVFKSLLAIYLAGWIALRLDMPSPMTAMITVIVVMHRQTGMVLAKSFYRVLGTLVGSVAALLIVAAFPQQPGLFILALALWIGLCTGGALLYRNFKAYAFVLSGYTVALIALPAINQPDQVFELATARVAEIMLGLLVTGVVSDVVFPSRLRTTLRDTVIRTHDGFLDFVRDATRGTVARKDMEQAYLRFVRDAVAIEDLRSSVVFEDAEARARSGRLQLLNQRFMAVSSGFQTLHQYINRLLGRDQVPTASALMAVYRPIGDALTDRGGHPQAQAVVERLQSCMETLPSRAAVARRPLAAQAGDDFDTGLSLLRRFLQELQDYVATGAALLARRDAAPVDDKAVFIRANDLTSAAIAALRGMLVVLVAGFLWLQSGWTSGGNAVFQAVALVAILSTGPHASVAARSISLGFVIGAVLGMACQFLLLPQVDGYGLLVAVTAPWLLFTLYLTTRPTLFGVALGINIGLLSMLNLQAMPNYDAAATFNNAIALVLGAGMVSVAFVFMPSMIGSPWQRRRLLQRLRGQVAQAARAPLAGLGPRFESVNRDLFHQVVSHAPPDSEEQRTLLAWALAVHEAGRSIIELRHDAADQPLPAGVAAVLEATVTALGELYATPSAEALARAHACLEQALDDTRQAPAVAQPLRPIREHLQLLRSALLDANSVLTAPLADRSVPAAAREHAHAH